MVVQFAGKVMRIRKNDIVWLPDGSEGTVVERVLTENITVYKIRKQDSLEYFDENKVRLKKRPFINSLLALLNLDSRSDKHA